MPFRFLYCSPPVVRHTVPTELTNDQQNICEYLHNQSVMIVLSHVRGWLHVIGVLDRSGDVRAGGGRRAMLSLAFGILIVPQCLYVRELLTDAFDIIFVAITTIAFLFTYWQYCVLVANRRLIVRLLQRIGRTAAHGERKFSPFLVFKKLKVDNWYR